MLQFIANSAWKWHYLPNGCQADLCLIHNTPVLVQGVTSSLNTRQYLHILSLLLICSLELLECAAVVWASSVSSWIFGWALGRDWWALCGWTQSAYWSLLGCLGEASLVHILGSRHKTPSSSAPNPHIFLLYSGCQVTMESSSPISLYWVPIWVRLGYCMSLSSHCYIFVCVSCSCCHLLCPLLLLYKLTQWHQHWDCLFH